MGAVRALPPKPRPEEWPAPVLAAVPTVEPRPRRVLLRFTLGLAAIHLGLLALLLALKLVFALYNWSDLQRAGLASVTAAVVKGVHFEAAGLVFDTAADPGCTHDLRADRPGVVSQLQSRLRPYMSLSRTLLDDNRIYPPADDPVLSRLRTGLAAAPANAGSGWSPGTG